MSTDVRLDDVDGTFVAIQGRVLKIEGSDFMLDSAERRKGGGPFRRALVHDQNDGLTINFSGDYPGGLALNGVSSIVPLSAPHGTGPLALVDPTPTLVVHGDISYEVAGQVQLGGVGGPVTTSIRAEFNKLHLQIADLTARIGKLEAKP